MSKNTFTWYICLKKDSWALYTIHMSGGFKHLDVQVLSLTRYSMVDIICCVLFFAH